MQWALGHSWLRQTKAVLEGFAISGCIDGTSRYNFNFILEISAFFVNFIHKISAFFLMSTLFTKFQLFCQLYSRNFDFNLEMKNLENKISLIFFLVAQIITLFGHYKIIKCIQSFTHTAAAAAI